MAYDVPSMRTAPLPESPNVISAAPVWSNSTEKFINFDNSFNDKSLASKMSLEASDLPLPLINLLISDICFSAIFILSIWISTSLAAEFLKFFKDLS